MQLCNPFSPRAAAALQRWPCFCKSFRLGISGLKEQLAETLAFQRIPTVTYMFCGCHPAQNHLDSCMGSRRQAIRGQLVHRRHMQCEAPWRYRLSHRSRATFQMQNTLPVRHRFWQLMLRVVSGITRGRCVDERLTYLSLPCVEWRQSTQTIQYISSCPLFGCHPLQ